MTADVTGEVEEPPLLRPVWRGVLHRWGALVAIPLFAALAVAAPAGGDRIAVVVYGVAVTAMLAVSATYHSGRLSPEATRRFKRLDHSTILVGIAGSYTAVTAMALEGTSRTVLLAVVWVAAIVGIAIRMLWLHAPYPLVAVVYVVTGWLAVLDLPGYVRGLTGVELALVVVGGLLYTAGAVVYALRRPDPAPATFGYHEVFHALVLGGALCHYLAVASLVAGR